MPDIVKNPHTLGFVMRELDLEELRLVHISCVASLMLEDAIPTGGLMSLAYRKIGPTLSLQEWWVTEILLPAYMFQRGKVEGPVQKLDVLLTKPQKKQLGTIGPNRAMMFRREPNSLALKCTTFHLL
jgi:hypothetical protein